MLSPFGEAFLNRFIEHEDLIVERAAQFTTRRTSPSSSWVAVMGAECGFNPKAVLPEMDSPTRTGASCPPDEGRGPAYSEDLEGLRYSLRSSGLYRFQGQHRHEFPAPKRVVPSDSRQNFPLASVPGMNTPTRASLPVLRQSR